MVDRIGQLPMSDSNPYFSIIIPTRNESIDILKTISSIQRNTFSNYEVLIVDASQDDTPKIVSGIMDSRVHLIPQNNRDGRCGARNQGIRQARGEILVILNADVRLPNDFLSRLKTHYDAGADYVIVDSIVENQDHPFGAMMQAEHVYLYSFAGEARNWCEGYSCRRSCAVDAGLFPEKLQLPICAGEDAVFGDNVAKKFRRVDDLELKVTHSVPESFEEFWAQRVGRGEGCSQRRILLDKWSFQKTFLDGIIWSTKSIFWLVLLFPLLGQAARLKNHLPTTRIRVLFWPLILNRLGHEFGRWKAFIKLYRLNH
jgi:glycosyltransferase involved in cell wall biosynthesis